MMALTYEEKVDRRARREKKRRDKESAAKHVKCRRYVFIAKHKETGEIRGYYSYSKKWEPNKVTLWTSNRFYMYACSPQEIHEVFKKRVSAQSEKTQNEWHFFMVRAGSKQCPIKLDYRRNLENHGKFITNILFTPKNEDS